MTGSQCDRILSVLADGRPKAIQEIHEVVGPCRLNSRIAELRSRGHEIVCWKAKLGRDFKGRDTWTYVYRLVLSEGEPRGDVSDDRAPSAGLSAATSGTAVTVSSPSPSAGRSDTEQPPVAAESALATKQLDLFDLRKEPAWA